MIPSWPQSASLLGQMELFDELQSSGGLQNYMKRPGVEQAQQFYQSQGAAELQRIEEQFGGG